MPEEQLNWIPKDLLAGEEVRAEKVHLDMAFYQRLEAKDYERMEAKDCYILVGLKRMTGIRRFAPEESALAEDLGPWVSKKHWPRLVASMVGVPSLEGTSQRCDWLLTY